MVSTEYARSVLPNHVPFKEAVQNVSHASLFVTSLITHQLNNLSVALDDNLHVQAVADAMGAVFTSNGIENRTYCLEADSTGASII